MADTIELNPVERLNQAQVKRLTAVHGWSGIILGLVLYVVVVTGTAVVFGPEIDAWSARGDGYRPTLTELSPVDPHLRVITERTPKGYLKNVSVYSNSRGEKVIATYAQVFNPEKGRARAYGSLYHLDRKTGTQLSRDEGFIYDDPRNYETSALEDFLVELHVRLYVPDPWGSILTGIMGFLVMAAGITGFLMHRHLIRDLFVSVRSGERLVTARDRHVLAASWSLIFAFLLGFTGSFYSFSGTITFPLVSEAAFGGDQDAMRTVMFQPEAAPDETAANVVNLDAVIQRSEIEAGSPPTFLGVENWGRADGRISVYHAPPEGGLVNVRNIFRAADGKFLGSKPGLGNAPSLGADIYGLIGPLHFGDFAGVLSQSVWVGLGTAMAYVIISGLRLWVRRREDEMLWRRFGRAVTITAYGLPLSMMSCAWFYFPALAFGDPFFWTPAGFFIGVFACLLFGAVTDDARLVRRFRRLLAIGCLGLPVLRMAMGGAGWAEAFTQAQGAVYTVDLAFLVLGGGLWLWANRIGHKEHPANSPPAPVAEPAE